MPVKTDAKEKIAVIVALAILSPVFVDLFFINLKANRPLLSLWIAPSRQLAIFIKNIKPQLF